MNSRAGLPTSRIDVDSINKEWGQQGNRTACKEMGPVIFCTPQSLRCLQRYRALSEMKK